MAWWGILHLRMGNESSKIKLLQFIPIHSILLISFFLFYFHYIPSVYFIPYLINLHSKPPCHYTKAPPITTPNSLPSSLAICYTYHQYNTPYLQAQLPLQCLLGPEDKGICSFETWGTTHATQHHIQGNFPLQQNCCQNLKSCVTALFFHISQRSHH